MKKSSSRAKTDKTRAWLSAVLAVAMTAMISACVVSDDGGGDGEDPESTTGWAWRSGSDSAGEAGVYGTKGTASASNVPGAREFTQAWFDSSNRAWLFGGYGYDAARTGGYLNDLWRYNPTSSDWTWVSGSNTVNQWGAYGTLGVPSAFNVPGARTGALTWLDGSGAVWLFGGRGFDGSGNIGYLNDMWKYDPASGQWSWMAGTPHDDRAGIYGTKGVPDPANTPGGRYGSVCWLDGDGKLWLFGGWGLDSVGAASDLNDLWRFDPATAEWTWMSGHDLVSQPGVYGTKGTASPTNMPGSRDTSVGWTDGGMFWLFGGGGFDAASQVGQLNDLWKFDPSTLQWTWVSGSNSVNQAGEYGSQGVGSTANIPGGNCGGRSWKDSIGKFWFFGGRGYDSVSILGALNDLWKFDPATLEWTWVAGNKTANHSGVYGPKNKRYLSNLPGGREYAASFQDANGRMWVFGGKGYDKIGVMNYLNDLWEYAR